MGQPSRLTEIRRAPAAHIPLLPAIGVLAKERSDAARSADVPVVRAWFARSGFLGPGSKSSRVLRKRSVLSGVGSIRALGGQPPQRRLHAGRSRHRFGHGKADPAAN